MNKSCKEKIRNIVGEGKLYEIRLSYGKIEFINTHENEFEVDKIDYFTFWKNVTDVKESKIVKQLFDIFGNDITILAYCCYHVSEKENGYVFKEETVHNSYLNTDSTLYITDEYCTYIVCTNNNRTKLKKFNTDFLGEIKVDSDYTVV